MFQLTKKPSSGYIQWNKSWTPPILEYIKTHSSQDLKLVTSVHVVYCHNCDQNNIWVLSRLEVAGYKDKTYNKICRDGNTIILSTEPYAVGI
jgi:hypothetical protein